MRILEYTEENREMIGANTPPTEELHLVVKLFKAPGNQRVLCWAIFDKTSRKIIEVGQWQERTMQGETLTTERDIPGKLAKDDKTRLTGTLAYRFNPDLK
jgi:hypothetical protein